MNMRLTKNGFGLMEAMIYLVVISIVIAVSLDFLQHSRTQEALRRRSGLTKKSFGGAELTMIDQRQCRCNLHEIEFPWDIARDEPIELERLKTYADADDCSDSPVDGILSDTTAGRTLENAANKILITEINMVIPKLLYRATVIVAPLSGRPVEFPILLNTHPINDDEVVVDICGVDRAS